MFETHYSILALSKTASRDQIEQAYRRMVRRCHPDLNPGDDAARQQFAQVQAAFDVLHNREKRWRYDQSLAHEVFRSQHGSLELFEDAAAVKHAGPLLAFTDKNDLDQLRFAKREPGTSLRLYRSRSRLIFIRDWLASSDFMLPLLLLLIFMGLQFAGAILEIFAAAAP